MIEDSKLIVEDYDFANELSTFIVRGNSFSLYDGVNDDLVACLFIFAWMTEPTIFQRTLQIVIFAKQ